MEGEFAEAREDLRFLEQVPMKKVVVMIIKEIEYEKQKFINECI